MGGILDIKKVIYRIDALAGLEDELVIQDAAVKKLVSRGSP